MAMATATATGSNDFPPPGFRFRPYEKELIKDFLEPKIFGYDPRVYQFLRTIRLSDFDASDLPRMNINTYHT